MFFLSLLALGRMVEAGMPFEDPVKYMDVYCYIANNPHLAEPGDLDKEPRYTKIGAIEALEQLSKLSEHGFTADEIRKCKNAGGPGLALVPVIENGARVADNIADLNEIGCQTPGVALRPDTVGLYLKHLKKNDISNKVDGSGSKEGAKSITRCPPALFSISRYFV